MLEIVDLKEYRPSDGEILSFFRMIRVSSQADWNFGEMGEELASKSDVELVNYFREKVLRDERGNQLWAKDGAAVVGFVGLHLQPETGCASIGFGVSESHQRQGIASALIAAAIAKARELGLKEIKAECFADNSRSIGLLIKSGFKQVGCRAKAVNKRGQWRDACDFSLALSSHQTRFIILEGIATSGKTSVKNKLAEALTKRGTKFSVIEEEETLMPVLNNTEREVGLALLRRVVARALAADDEVIIFDRLYFTHIFRTGSEHRDFAEIERLLGDRAFLAFLKVEEAQLPARIAAACQQRGGSWEEHVRRKGSDEEVNDYYINQQRRLLKLLAHTALPHKIYDATEKDFTAIAADILKVSDTFVCAKLSAYD
jgi:RimJ/RimL family protein N-acetyltransferase/thymidylate kinase